MDVAALAKWDVAMMKRALFLAEKGRGFTHPKPIVGSVLADPQQGILAQGYYAGAGAPHAEAAVLNQVTNVPPTATLFVTLEPCSVRDKGETCCDRIIRQGVKRVVYGTIDQNPLHQGAGLEKLRNQQIAVCLSALEQKCRAQNEIFFHACQQRKTFVAIKAAMSLDGRIALANGSSQWITALDSRHKTHFLRKSYQSILIGAGTLRSDNPALTCRLTGVNYQPIQLVCSTDGVIPQQSHFIAQQKVPKYLFAGNRILPKQKDWLEQHGVRVVVANTPEVVFNQMMDFLWQQNITSVLLEGGAQMFTQAQQARRVNKYHLFYAPKIFGAQSLPVFLSLQEVTNVNQCDLRITDIQKLSNDFYVELQTLKHSV